MHSKPITISDTHEPETNYTRSELVELFTKLRNAIPKPKIELNYTNPFTLLVAVVLAAQSTDTGVNKATSQIFPIADTPERMLAIGEDKLRELIRTIGIFKNKAKNIISLSAKLINEFDGKVPSNKKDLIMLPGVGTKTANVILNECFGIPTIAVDTHVFRLANRLLLAPGKTPRIVEEKLGNIIPKTFKKDAHQLLVLHGRYICKARKPLCAQCIINNLCKSPDKQLHTVTRS